MIDEWINTTIGEQATLQRGVDITKAKQRIGKVPVISSGGISSYHDTPSAIGPGVILGRKGVVGSVYFVSSDYWPHDTTLWVKDFHGNYPRFVYYFFRWLAPRIASMDVGSANPTLNRNHVHPIQIRWPPLPEQYGIARILGTLDDKIELNHKMNKNLEDIGKTIFKHWFIDFEFPNKKGTPYKSSGGNMISSELGKIPEGWKVSRIGDEVKTILGGTPDRTNPAYWEGGTISWINSGQINDFPLVNPTEYISELGLKNSATKIMPIKTVVLPLVISMDKPINISILGIETSGNQSVLGIVGNDKLSAEFIYYWISFRKQEMYSWATGGAQQHINKNNVDKTLILIPEKNITDNFDVFARPLFDKLINNAIQNKILSQSLRALLPKLMSGKIRVPVEAR
jgi:type I restriction enzyme S subunit